MEISNPILLEFINDFQLKSIQNDTICFDAVIQYEAKHDFKQLESEVNLVSINKRYFAIFSLLNPDIVTHNLPNTLIVQSNNFKYNKNISLIIYGSDNVSGKYSVTITPLNKNCTQETLYELRAKKLN